MPRPPVKDPPGPRYQQAQEVASVSFGIYFAIAGAVFLDASKVPQYKFEDRRLAGRGAPGLVRGRCGTLLIMFMQLATRMFGRLRLPAIARSTLDGSVGPVHFPHHDASPPQVATQRGAVSAGAFHVRGGRRCGSRPTTPGSRLAWLGTRVGAADAAITLPVLTAGPRS